jgi:hypothetical protein
MQKEKGLEGCAGKAGAAKGQWGPCAASGEKPCWAAQEARRIGRHALQSQAILAGEGRQSRFAKYGEPALPSPPAPVGEGPPKALK